MIDEEAIGEPYRALAGELDDPPRRLWAAASARSHGRGGLAAVVRATGIAENTVRSGLRELEAGHRLEPGAKPERRPQAALGNRSDLVADLERLVDPDSRSEPEQPLRWTAKSVRTLAEALRGLGHRLSHETVAHPAAFAVASIRSWWQQLGSQCYPKATTLTITADWRRQRQPHPSLEDRAARARRRDRPCDHGLPLPAGHEQVEQGRASALLLHRPELARQPLLSREVIVNLIATASRSTLA